MNVIISYQMQNLQFSIFKIVTCEAFIINTKILSFFQQKLGHYASYKKIPWSKHSFSTFYICSKFQSFRSNNNFFLKLNRSPYFHNIITRHKRVLSTEASVIKFWRNSLVWYYLNMPIKLIDHRRAILADHCHVICRIHDLF